MSELTGIDAFDNIVERMIAAHDACTTERDRRNDMEVLLRQAQKETADAKRCLAAYARRQEQDANVHAVLKDTKLALVGVSDNANLMSRIDQAIRDTDEIPF